MKILILNGSPRLNGNTSFALSEVADGITKNTDHYVETINVAKLNVGGCTACNACKENGGNCIMKDDSKCIIDKVESSDALIIGTPVYWWGMSSQMKAVIDKFYSKTAQFKEQDKKIGIVAIGTGAVTNKQYELIHEQFNCISNFLGWGKIFGFSYSASAQGDLQKSETAAQELSETWRML